VRAELHFTPETFQEVTTFKVPTQTHPQAKADVLPFKLK
jgi:hypothetical protein